MKIKFYYVSGNTSIMTTTKKDFDEIKNHVGHDVVYNYKHGTMNLKYVEQIEIIESEE